MNYKQYIFSSKDIEPVDVGVIDCYKMSDIELLDEQIEEVLNFVPDNDPLFLFMKEEKCYSKEYDIANKVVKEFIGGQYE